MHHACLYRIGLAQREAILLPVGELKILDFSVMPKARAGYCGKLFYQIPNSTLVAFRPDNGTGWIATVQREKILVRTRADIVYPTAMLLSQTGIWVLRMNQRDAEKGRPCLPQAKQEELI